VFGLGLIEGAIDGSTDIEGDMDGSSLGYKDSVGVGDGTDDGATSCIFDPPQIQQASAALFPLKIRFLMVGKVHRKELSAKNAQVIVSGTRLCASIFQCSSSTHSVGDIDTLGLSDGAVEGTFDALGVLDCITEGANDSLG